MQDVHLFGIDNTQLLMALNLWSIGEIGRNKALDWKLKNLLKEDEEQGILAIRMQNNEEASWVWGDLFKQFKENNADTCAVYFIENSYGDRVKIGMTKNLWRRFTELNQASGGQCRILLAIPVASRYMAHTEKMFHLIFEGKHIQGEWFKKADENGDYVADIVHGLYEGLKREEVA